MRGWEEVGHALSIASYLHCESTHAHVGPYTLITSHRAEGVHVPRGSARALVSWAPQGGSKTSEPRPCPPCGTREGPPPIPVQGPFSGGDHWLARGQQKSVGNNVLRKAGAGTQLTRRIPGETKLWSGSWIWPTGGPSNLRRFHSQGSGTSFGSRSGHTHTLRTHGTQHCACSRNPLLAPPAQCRQ